MRNILIVLSSSNVGGAEKQCLYLIEKLKVDHRVGLVLLGKKGEYFEKLLEAGIPTKYSRGSLFSDIYVLIRSIIEVKPSVQINWLYRADIIGGLVGRIFRVPKIINSARNTNWPGFSRSKRFAMVFSAKYLANNVVANSRNAAIWHQEIGYPSEKIKIISNFIKVKPEYSVSIVSPKKQKPIRLGIASRPVEGKGHRLLIAAQKILKLRGIESELWFIGHGIPAWEVLRFGLFEEDTNLKLFEGIFDLEQWFGSIDIYCGISEAWESDSNSINEAVLYGLPIIVSDLIESNRYSPEPTITNSGDPLSVATAIESLINRESQEIYRDISTRRRNLIDQRAPDRLFALWKDVIG